MKSENFIGDEDWDDIQEMEVQEDEEVIVPMEWDHTDAESE